MKYNIDEGKVIKELSARLEKALDGKLFSVNEKVRLNAPFARILYGDVVISDVNKNPYALFEVRGFPKAWTLRVLTDSSILRTLRIIGVRYYIITDGVEFWIRSSEDSEFTQTDFDSLIYSIKEGLSVLGPIPSLDDINKALETASSVARIKQSNAIMRFVRRKRTRPLFKTDATTGWIEFANAKAEDSFFSFLLNGRVPTNLCRFTTRHNLFLLLKDGKQNMCSIVCMNDKSEENYADDKVGLKKVAKSTLFDNNNCFIMSLMPEDKSDDLTMWRLYGDDAKGVCLNYEIENRHRGRRLKGDFYISAISYGVDDKCHPELDFLKAILNSNINNWHFHFNRWEVWKHFFKSFRFKDEKEIRLLYISKDKSKEDKKWIENEDSGIVSKMLLFNMNPTNEFPLRLSNVIVGPKAPEPAKIAEQFTFILKQEWDKYSPSNPIVIRESRINEYR